MADAWVYVMSERAGHSGATADLYTVGFYDPTGGWHPDQDTHSREEAARRCAFLNGNPQSTAANISNITTMTLRQRAAIAAMQGIVSRGGGTPADVAPHAIELADELLHQLATGKSREEDT